MLKKAKEWLTDRLLDGPDLAKSIITDAEAIGIKYDTLSRARNELGYETVRATFANQEWMWFDPNLTMDEQRRQDWFEKHKDWIEDYRDPIDFELKGEEWNAAEFFNEWREDLYEQIATESTYYFNSKERKSPNSIEAHYKKLIDALKATNNPDNQYRIDLLEKHLASYVENKKVMTEGIKSHYSNTDIGKIDRWLLDSLKSGPRERKVLVEEAKKEGYAEADLEKSRIKLRLEVIAGRSDNVWWSDLDREVRKTKGVKEQFREDRKEANLHRSSYDKQYSLDEEGEKISSFKSSENKIPSNQFFDESKANKSDTNSLSPEEVEGLKLEYNKKLEKEVFIPKIEYSDENKNIPSYTNVKTYKRWSKI